MDLEKPYWEQDQIEMARIYTDKLFIAIWVGCLRLLAITILDE